MVEQVVTIEVEGPVGIESVAKSQSPIDDGGLALLGSGCGEEDVAEVAMC